METNVNLENQHEKPETLSYDMIEKMYTEILTEKSTIKDLIKNFPNDMELGKKVRNLFGPK